MTYIGSEPNYGALHSQTITTANGSTATFTLDQYVPDADSIIVTIGNVEQEPVTAYTASGNSITFTENVPNGDTIVIRYLGRQIDVPTSYTQSTRYKYVATNNQTTFSGADANSLTLSYTTGNIDLYLNGVHLDESDFTATNGTSVVLGSGAATNDELVIVAWKTVQISNALDKTAGGTVTGATTFSGAFTSKGIDDNADATSITIDSAENVGIKTTPESWHSNWTAIDFGDQGHIAHYDGGDTQIGTNLYHDGVWKAKETGTSALYAIGGGGYHQWYSGASASADSAVTLTPTLSVDANGIVTKPNQPAFYAYSTGSGWNHDNIIVWNSTAFNQGNHFNTSNGKFTAPVAGVYMFNHKNIGNNSSSITRVKFYLNDAVMSTYKVPQTRQDNSQGNDYSEGVLNIVAKLSANDTIKLGIFSDDSSSGIYNDNSGQQSYNYFNGFLIG